MDLLMLSATLLNVQQLIERIKEQTFRNNKPLIFSLLRAVKKDRK